MTKQNKKKAAARVPETRTAFFLFDFRKKDTCHMASGKYDDPAYKTTVCLLG